jgi:multiple sugar transport system ATP-binding protein
MRGELKRLQHELGTTTVYVTHDQAEAMTLATRVAVMRGGRLQQFDTLYRILKLKKRMAEGESRSASDPNTFMFL